MRHLLPLLAIVLATQLAAQAPAAPHPKQGLADMLLEYMSVRYPKQDLSGHVLYISVRRQRLYHVHAGALRNEFTIATATNGLGSYEDSYRTPTGLHRISHKYGEGVPPWGILQDRVFSGVIAQPDAGGPDKDWITSRILWVEGLEPGINKGADPLTGRNVDSHERFIYLHGTANEASLGSPSSMGCIRMRNADVIALYDQVPIGALVVVLDN